MNRYSFTLRTARDFYNVLIENYHDYLEDRLSSKKAINCAMAAFHLKEWVDQEASANSQEKLELPVAIKQSWVLLGDIANGSKHYLLTRRPRERIVRDTSAYYADFSQEFSNEFGIEDALVGTTVEGNSFDFLTELETVVAYWKEYFEPPRNYSFPSSLAG